MKKLAELSADDLETLRAMPKPSMSQQNREDESQLPGKEADPLVLEFRSLVAIQYLRIVKLGHKLSNMSKRFPKLWRNAETPEELLEVRSVNPITESQLPGAGVRLIFGIVVGIGLTLFVVGVIWRFLMR